MDQFRRVAAAAAAEEKDRHESSSSTFSPPSIIRDSSSAFSKPILPSSSSLLSPKPHFGSSNGAGAGAGAGASARGSSADPLTSAAARYRECLRNHAASLGGHVVDGCGEFMPLGPADLLKCAACGCHRSFHRREAEPDSRAVPLPLLLPPGPHPSQLMRLSGGNTTDQSSSEERNTVNTYGNNNNNNNDRSSSYKQDNNGQFGEGSKKKRFRTKFSSEQKDKMRAFAERVGWRVQKKEDGEMERLCNEVGVTRQVLKVWMHNNKHLLKKQHNESSSSETNYKVEGVQQLEQHQHQHHHHHHQDGVV